MKLATLLPLSKRIKLAEIALDEEARKLMLAAKKVRTLRQKGMHRQ